MSDWHKYRTVLDGITVPEDERARARATLTRCHAEDLIPVLALEEN